MYHNHAFDLKLTLRIYLRVLQRNNLNVKKNIILKHCAGVCYNFRVMKEEITSQYALLTTETGWWFANSKYIITLDKSQIQYICDVE